MTVTVSDARCGAVERLESVLDALAHTGAQINSIVRPDADGARRTAARLDGRSFTDGDSVPLAGLPISVKDSFDAQGMISSHGIIVESHLAAIDAPAVAQLRAAGCVVVGKTNVSRRLADYQADSEEFGQTRNPLDPARTAGGSSGGAAAVAAGHSALDLGSDMAGSVRLPAMFCGVAAWRPTHGVVSKGRHLPWPGHLRVTPPASTVGVITRHVAELAAPAAVLTRRQELSPTSMSRIGVWMPEWPMTGSEVRAVIEAWLQRLRDAAIEVVPVRPRHGDERALATYRGLIAAEIAHGVGDTSEAAPLLSLVEQQLAAREEWSELLSDVDAVVAPVAPVVAPVLSSVPIGERLIDIDGRPHPADEMLTWCTLTSLSQAPSVTVYVGTDAADGLPVAVQIIGRHNADLELIAGVAEWERRGLAGREMTQ